MSSIFISYRRDDSAPYAGRLYDRLSAHFGAGEVFMDIDQIEPGEDFVEVIERKVGACATAVVLIGPRWLGAVDAQGYRRLDDAGPAPLNRRQPSEPVSRGDRAHSWIPGCGTSVFSRNITISTFSGAFTGLGTPVKYWIGRKHTYKSNS